ncbi:hypothetical protein NIES267_71350 (plasmid) [Calothrix parasitica NIES-267]|uniref:Insertion element IS150 protein InsJ-like helix-turn-helix domain-containing protein n=1 Tax=Calothrix parasitica NIES-267 TaxID=1973488 RepID=A0A1Z4M2H4_9CYAN|nr:hypothetical protein NIES267_71350 [Calothrix parasitica NIES-267]
MADSFTNKTMQLCERELDLQLWQKLYYQNQKDYLRKRLLAIRYLYDDKTRTEVSELLHCEYKTITTWIDKYLTGGLDELVKPISHKVSSKLTLENKQELRRVLLSDEPAKYGIDKNVWTIRTISILIELKWGVKLKTTRTYEIVKEFRIS